MVTKFYCFGLIKRRWIFYKTENIKITSAIAGFGDKFEPPTFDAWDSADLGCMAFILFIFFPTRITHKKFTVESIDNSKKTLKHVQILLDKQEYDF